MEHSDDHERYLSGEEEPNDHNQHQGGVFEVPLSFALLDQVLAKITIKGLSVM